MTDVPHFSLPFRFTPQAAVSEQDSIDEITDCVLAVLSCPLGFRVDLPEFGIADPVFSTPAVDVDELRTAVDGWEPRAQTVFDEQPDKLDQLLDHVQVLVNVRTQE